MPARRLAPTGDPALKTPARRRLREQVRALGIREHTPCLAPRCRFPGQPINYQRRTRGQAYDPLAYELDEILTRDQGGRADDPGNVRPRHAGCNRSAGTRITNAKRRAKRLITMPTLVLDDW